MASYGGVPESDWIFTPPMILQANSLYKLSFSYHVLTSPEGVELPEKLEVKWGTEATVESMFIEPLFSNQTITNLNYTLAEVEFSPSSNNDYFIGFHCFSDPMQWMIIIDDIKIENLTSNTEVPLSLIDLKQNYPNPFNPTTKIEFELKTSRLVNLKIYNAKGQLVKTLVNSKLDKGLHSIIWDGSDNQNKKHASGIYFYRLENGNQIITKKMIMIK